MARNLGSRLGRAIGAGASTLGQLMYQQDQQEAARRAEEERIAAQNAEWERRQRILQNINDPFVPLAPSALPGVVQSNLPGGTVGILGRQTNIPTPYRRSQLNDAITLAKTLNPPSFETWKVPGGTAYGTTSQFGDHISGFRADPTVSTQNQWKVYERTLRDGRLQRYKVDSSGNEVVVYTEPVKSGGGAEDLADEVGLKIGRVTTETLQKGKGKEKTIEGVDVAKYGEAWGTVIPDLNVQKTAHLIAPQVIEEMRAQDENTTAADISAEIVRRVMPLQIESSLERIGIERTSDGWSREGWFNRRHAMTLNDLAEKISEKEDELGIPAFWLISFMEEEGIKNPEEVLQGREPVYSDELEDF